MTRSLAPLFAACACLLAAACGGSTPSTITIRITALPDAKTTELDPKYSLVANYLSETLGKPVEYVAVTDYRASVEAFKNGDVQLAWFGGVTGVQARHAVPGSRAIAYGTIDPRFRSVFVAHRDAKVAPTTEFPMALEGLDFTFGNADSTSGRVMPQHFLKLATGKDPEAFFGKLNLNGGKHPLVAKAVESGAYQAGVLNFKTYRDMVQAGDLDPKLCVKIWETPIYADYNWTAHPDLDRVYGKGFTNKLQAALVSIEDPTLLDALQRPDGLIEAKNEDFTDIEAICRDIGLIED